jgi:hypothetical protein
MKQSEAKGRGNQKDWATRVKTQEADERAKAAEPYAEHNANVEAAKKAKHPWRVWKPNDRA